MFAYKEIKTREEHIIARSADIWESSVRATHSFLTADEIEGIKQYVPKLLREVEHLIVAEDKKGVPVAFAGIGGRKLEMLFVAASHIGEGIGKSLLCRAVDDYDVDELTVNEENARAVGFYEHMGFQPYAGTE